MKYRKLGNSELVVSEITLGSWLTYGVGVDTTPARACIAAAFDCGINFFDTANVYGLGAAETFLGKALADHSRDDYILATKAYFPMSETDQGLSPQQIHKQIDASLKRLATEYVDLYQCHRFDEQTPLEQTMQALSEVVASGKARYIGFSEWQPQQIQSALEMPDVVQFVSSQPQYSMIWRHPEHEVMPLCADNGISQIVWSPLAQGVLTGKYKANQVPPKNSRATNRQMNGFIDHLINPTLLNAVEKLNTIAADVGVSNAQLALAWVLRQDNVASAIIGASRPDQVHENAAASGVSLPADVLQRIDAALDGVILS